MPFLKKICGVLALAGTVFFTSCSGAGSACAFVDIYPADTTTAPSMTFYFGSTSDATGTALSSAGQFSGYIASGGCGPFGIWESSNGGEVATEIEIRLNTRLGVFAMAEGVVVLVQNPSSPSESGEVEGVWIRYGENYVIKYVHVKDPIVKVGEKVSSGQRIGSTVAISNGQYFWEAELRYKTSSTVYAKAWNSLLTNAAVFNSLYGSGNCTPGSTVIGTDGTTVTTSSSWVNDSLSPAEWNVTAYNQYCTL